MKGRARLRSRAKGRDLRRASLVERCRREDRGAEEERGCSHPTGEGVWGGAVPRPENLSIFELKKASFVAFWVLFFAVD